MWFVFLYVRNGLFGLHRLSSPTSPSPRSPSSKQDLHGRGNETDEDFMMVVAPDGHAEVTPLVLKPERSSGWTSEMKRAPNAGEHERVGDR